MNAQRCEKCVCVCGGASPFVIEVQRKYKAKQKHSFANPLKLFKKKKKSRQAEYYEYLKCGSTSWRDTGFPIPANTGCM